MGTLVRDALTALIAPSVEQVIAPLVGRIQTLEATVGTLQVPADLADRLAALEARAVYDPGVAVALSDAITQLAGRIAALEAVPVLSDADQVTLDKAASVIAELEEIVAGVQSTPA